VSAYQHRFLAKKARQYGHTPAFACRAGPGQPTLAPALKVSAVTFFGEFFRYF
jgi:hypothetical protein